MGQVKIKIGDKDVSQFLETLSPLSEHTDESKFFSGIFRRSNLNVTFNNQSGMFNEGAGGLFPTGRNNREVEIIYSPNQKEIGDLSVFTGVIHEGSTENNLTDHQITLQILDHLKLLDDVEISKGDQKLVDAMWTGLEIKLNAQYISNFLTYIIGKGSLDLTHEVGVTIGSIFPPSDEYYSAEGVSSLSILTEMAQATNSFIKSLGNKILVLPRPIASQVVSDLGNSEILHLRNQTNGFNKVYNSISINRSNPYLDDASISKYGVRRLDVSGYAPPSKALADTYFDYYSEPKEEFDLLVRMNNRTLSLEVADGVRLNIEETPSNNIQEKKGSFFITNRTLNFAQETIEYRLRAI